MGTTGTPTWRLSAGDVLGASGDIRIFPDTLDLPYDLTRYGGAASVFR